MQFCVVLVVVSSLAATSLVSSETVEYGTPKFIGVLLSMAIVVLFAWGISASSVATAQARSEPISRTIDRLQKWTRAHLILWTSVCLGILWLFDWPLLLVVEWPVTRGIIGDEVVLLLPMLVSLFLSWAAFYDFEFWLAEYEGEHGLTRFGFVLEQARYFVFPVLLPMLVVAGVSDTFDMFFPHLAEKSWAGFVRAAPLGAILLAYPWMIRWLWQTTPLPASGLRRKLMDTGLRFRTHLSDVLVWNTRGRMINAAVTGLVPRWRYVLLTDGLLERLEDEEVEAIFLHELGHLKHRHSLRLMIGVFLSLSAALVVLVYPGEHYGADLQIRSVAVVLLGLFCFGGVGRYAWLLEFEADLWAVYKGRCGRRCYFKAFAKIVGEARDSSGWLHPSFARRRQFLATSNGPASDWLTWQIRWVESVILVFPWSVAMLAILWLTP